MTIADLNLRIENAQKKIQKKRITIDKKNSWILSGKKDEYEIGWLKEDIERLNSEIAETEKTIEKYQKQLSGEMKRESVFLKDIPDSMKRLQKELVERWNEYDYLRRNQLKSEYEELGYSQFIKEYKYTGYQFIHSSDDEIKKENERNAKAFIIDLYNRVNHITGEVTDWSNIFCSGSALDGFVIGKEGKAKVETITAGGYNVQRFHIRVLVHSLE